MHVVSQKASLTSTGGQAAAEVSPDGFAWGCYGSALGEPFLVATGLF